MILCPKKTYFYKENALGLILGELPEIYLRKPIIIPVNWLSQ